MGQRRKLEEFDRPDRVPLADLQRWLNTIPRKPGGQLTRYTHQDVRNYLRELEVQLDPLTDRKGSKLFFRLSDLRRQAPILAAAFERGATTPPRAEAEA